MLSVYFTIKEVFNTNNEKSSCVPGDGTTTGESEGYELVLEHLVFSRVQIRVFGNVAVPDS